MKGISSGTNTKGLHPKKLDSKFQIILNTFAPESRLEAFNEIMAELEFHGFLKEKSEIKYRISGGENMTLVFLDVLTRIEEPPLTIRNFSVILDGFIDEDIYKLFK